VKTARFGLGCDDLLKWRTTVTPDDARKLANDWVAAWNAHDLEAILMHYEDAVELISSSVAHYSA